MQNPVCVAYSPCGQCPTILAASLEQRSVPIVNLRGTELLQDGAAKVRDNLLFGELTIRTKKDDGSEG